MAADFVILQKKQFNRKFHNFSTADYFNRTAKQGKDYVEL